MKNYDFKLLIEKTGMTLDSLSDLTGYNKRTIYRWENGETQPRKAVINLLERISEKNNSFGKEKNDFTFIDLFAGIGGIRMGFEKAGGKCVFTSEWNKFARQTYFANFGCQHEVAGDITQVYEKEIPAHDVLLAGFPCQPFSLAGVSKKNSLGKNHGFQDKTQGTLFFDIARILAYHKPKAFLLENVKNLASHDKGKTFKIIKEILEKDLGYHVDVAIIDGKGYVPQHRERLYISGFKNDYGFKFENIGIKEPGKGPRLKTILHPEDGTEKVEEPYTVGKEAYVNPKYTLSPKLWAYLQSYAEKHRLKGNGFGYGLVDEDTTARTLSARYHKDGSEILVKQLNNRPRRLTPRECARLMGFDNPGESKFQIPVSDTQAYKQFGNSVVVPVIESIASNMKPFILKASGNKKKDKISKIPA